jgi:hypothetical protein
MGATPNMFSEKVNTSFEGNIKGAFQNESTLPSKKSLKCSSRYITNLASPKSPGTCDKSNPKILKVINTKPQTKPSVNGQKALIKSKMVFN